MRQTFGCFLRSLSAKQERGQVVVARCFDNGLHVLSLFLSKRCTCTCRMQRRTGCSRPLLLSLSLSRSTAIALLHLQAVGSFLFQNYSFRSLKRSRSFKSDASAFEPLNQKQERARQTAVRRRAPLAAVHEASASRQAEAINDAGAGTGSESTILRCS